MSFGFIGTGFTQSTSANSGVFSVNDLQLLKNNNKLSTAGILADYLVVAGGGGGASGHTSGAGGGAGGVRCTIDATGGVNGQSNVEPKYLLKYGQTYTVAIGGGSGGERQNGGRSQLGKIISVGGGGGASITVGSGGSGGGAISRNWYVGYGFSLDNHYVFNDLQYGSENYYSDDNSIEQSIFNQGYNGGSTGAGAGGGGAGATTGNSTSGGIGIQTSITGTSIYYGGGGGGGAGNYGSNSNNVFYASGGNGGGGGSSTTGAANRGGGGGGGYIGAAGGSGFVVIRYPDTFPDITTIGAGLVYTLDTSVTGYKIYKFTSGSDTITI